MALIFWGSTECGICGKVLNVEDPMVTFPNIIQNESDPFYGFNDQAYHLTCLMNSPQWGEIDWILKRYSSFKMERKCIVCEHSITSPDEYLNLGFLSADSKAPLFKYNFFEFHRQHFNRWSEKEEMQKYLRQQKDDKLWSGNSLDWILEM